MLQPFYASSEINRHGDYRNNKKLLKKIMINKNTKYIPVCNGKNLFKKNVNVNYHTTQELEASYQFKTYFNEANKFFVQSYYECSPVAIATNLVADAIANLQLTAIDRKKEYNSEAKIITKLQTVNLNQTFYEFLQYDTSHYLSCAAYLTLSETCNFSTIN